MNLSELGAHVTPAKLEALKEKLAELNINLADIDEQFVRGSGKGGQKVNKTSNAVVLRYAPLGLVIKVHRERLRSLNRFLALRELVERVQMVVAPGESERTKERDRIRKQKKRNERRRFKKGTTAFLPTDDPASAGREDVGG